MNKYRRLFFAGLIMVAVELGSVGLLNYLVDPYGIFRYGTWRHDVPYQFREPSKSFIKTRYIALNPKKYDCLIFGSSRVNGIDGRQVKDATCYNMHYSDGLPRNHLDNLRYILQKGARPRIVLIGLDEFSYKEDPAQHFTDYTRYPYPPAVHQNVALFYLKYLIRYSSRSMKRSFEGFAGKRPPYEYDHYDTGLETATLGEVDRLIEAEPLRHESDPKFQEPMITEGDRMVETLEEIRETVDLLKTHRVRLVLFINPIHKTTYLAAGLGKFLLFERELSRITSFYDFSGLNSITTNNYYYYETSHYRRNVGALMLARIFKDSTVKMPEEFGVLVTRDNIDQHIADLKTQVAGLGSAVKW